MMRRPLAPTPAHGPRFNEFITVPKVRVIDENGENLGVMFTNEAIEQAKKDWAAAPTGGRFGTVPGESEFIPLPE